MGNGRVVILNGASSAGKTTIAEKFVAERASRGEWWLAVALDDFLAKLVPEWFAAPDHTGEFATEGVRFVPSSLGLAVELGPDGRRLLTLFRTMVADAARLGFDVIVDEVMFEATAVDEWRTTLVGLDVTWVAVRCDADVAEAREATRGDRYIGLARALTDVVHRHATYDIDLDTTDTSPDELVSRLDAALG